MLYGYESNSGDGNSANRNSKGQLWLIAALRFYKQDLGLYRNDFVSER
jgi:hypothetical protein